MRAGGKDRGIKAGRSKVSTTWRVAGAEPPEQERYSAAAANVGKLVEHRPRVRPAAVLLAVLEASIRAQIHGETNLRQTILLKRYLVSTTGEFRNLIVEPTRFSSPPNPKFRRLPAPVEKVGLAYIWNRFHDDPYKARGLEFRPEIEPSPDSPKTERPDGLADNRICGRVPGRFLACSFGKIFSHDPAS